MKTNPFGGQTTTTPKQEPIHYINPRGHNNYANSQNSQRRRSGFRGRPYTRGTQNTRGQQSRPTNLNTQNQFYKCGNQFGQNHLQSFQQRTKFAQNAPSGATLQNYVDLQTLVTWETEMMNNKKK